MNLVIQNSIVLIRSTNPSNRRFGTGFIIHHDIEKSISYVVTCAHVLRDMPDSEEIQIDGNPSGIAYNTFDDLDLALVTTKGSLGRPIIKMGAYGRIGSPFSAAGFSLYGTNYSIRNIDGVLAEKMELLSTNETGRIPAWGLKIQGDLALQDGFSGSPVIEKESGYCVGVINYKQSEGRAGLAISVEALERYLLGLPGLPRDLIATLQEQSDEDYLGVLFSKATRLRLTGDLGEALDIYRRIKLSAPQYPQIDITIALTEHELRESYVDPYGRIIEREVMAKSARPLPSGEYSRSSRRAIPSCGLYLYIVIAVIIIGILVYLLLHGFFK